MSQRTNIFIAGHNGMVGSALARKLSQDPGNLILTAGREELDLTDQQSVNDYFAKNKIDQVYLAAAKVGGIIANNTYPAEFIYQNLMIEANIIHAAHAADINKLLFLGSSCIYPKLAAQPMTEESLLTGLLEPTNEPYAIAKIAGIKLCESYNRQYSRDYRSVMPTNLYGPRDNYHPKNSHVVPALIRRFHEAVETNQKEVVIWGSGNAMREFLHVDDMAEASIFVMNLDYELYSKYVHPMCSHLNVGSGQEVTIVELANIIAQVTGFRGGMVFDTSKPDGTPRKLLNVSKLKMLGWQSRIGLEEGLRDAYLWFLGHRVDQHAKMTHFLG